MLIFSRNIVLMYVMLYSMLLSFYNCYGKILIEIIMIVVDFLNVWKMRFVVGDNFFRDDSIN